jgi:hypothetical protein
MGVATQSAPTPRFNLLAALWAAGQRLRQRWSPLLAVTLGLLISPALLLSAIYATPGSGRVGQAVVYLVGLAFSGLAGGAIAWLSLAGGEKPWKVAAEGLGRAFQRLSPLAGFVLIASLPSLLVYMLRLTTPTILASPEVMVWAWWGLSLAASLLMAAFMAVVAPTAGILMFEEAGLPAALAQALRMTRGSRLKLILLQAGQAVLLGAIGLAVSQFGRGVSAAAQNDILSALDAVAGALLATVLNQSYFQLHANGD